jgi:ATPase complex subunit ATP10
VQINSQENLLKAALVSLFASSIRRSIPSELQSTYLLSSQDLTMEKEALALHNKHVGYMYLVGPDLKIRWAACAFSNGKEAESLVACIAVLLERMKEERPGR